jgi:nitroreductase
VSREIIEYCLLTAGSTVSGANMQPWQFVVVENPDIKHRLRLAAEKEEKEFYETKAPEEWLRALEPLGTDANKPFLETAPYLIAIFQQRFGILPDGEKIKHYYATESVGIATGVLISAIHHAGLACLTHTPSPMGFLNEILDRPRSERPFLLLVVGYPEEGAKVPDIGKKSLSDISSFL